MYSRSSRKTLSWLWAATSIFLTSCYPVTRVQTPRTTPSGRVHAAVGVAVHSSSAYDEHQLGVSPDVAVRVGLTDNADVSLRLRQSAAELSFKLQLVRQLVEVSLAPAFVASEEIASFSDANQYADRLVDVLAGRLTAYVGSDVEQPFFVWVAPTIDVGERTFSTEELEDESQPLAAVGALLGLGRTWSREARTQVELGFLIPIAGDAIVTDHQTRLGPGDVRFEIGLAFLFGSFAPDAE